MHWYNCKVRMLYDLEYAYVKRPVGREKLAFEEGLLEVDLLRDIGTTILVML